MAGRGSAFGRIADWFIPGNAYNSTMGRWNPNTTKVGIAGMVADQFVPGGSNLVGMLANGGALGSGIANGLQRENTFNGIADQFGQTRSELADYLHSQKVDMGGYNPQVSVGQPQFASVGSFAPSLPAMPAVETQAPWQGLGTSTGGLFQGGQLGSWANPAPQQPAQRVAGQNRGGWTGDAARSIFSGLSDASRFNASAQSFGDYMGRSS